MFAQGGGLRLAAAAAALCALAGAATAFGQSPGEGAAFREDFSSGRIDWAGTWDTDGGRDSFKSLYRVDRLSAGFLVHERQSYAAHAIHDYLREEFIQVARPTTDGGFWDEEEGGWAGKLLWSPEGGWYAATPHEWRFSVELEEGAFMASMMSPSGAMDVCLKAELLHIRKYIADDGTVADLNVIAGTGEGGYEYGVILSALALGSRYFALDDGPASDAAYEDMRKIFGHLVAAAPERMHATEDLAVVLRGLANASRAAAARGDTILEVSAREKLVGVARQFLNVQGGHGVFDLLDRNVHVQKQLKADLGLLLAYEVTGDRRCVDAVKRNMSWIVANRFDGSPKGMGGLMWADDDQDTFFECHQAWFILVERRLEACDEISLHPYLEEAFAFLTDDNFAGVDMYEHNAETYGPFFAYRAISRDGSIQQGLFCQWKGAYEIGASLWALASLWDVSTEGHSRLQTQAPEDSSNSWDKALFTHRDFGKGYLRFRWDVRFKDTGYDGAYTGLFATQGADGILLLDTTRGFSYMDVSGRQRVLVGSTSLRSGAVYTVEFEKRRDNLFRAALFENGSALFDDLIDDVRQYGACYFGVFQANGGFQSAKAIWVDNVECAPLLSQPAGEFPLVARLYPGYPNPFNARVAIDYDVSERGPVMLRVYSAAGELVAELAGGVLEPGRYSALWDGRDRSGTQAASGIYFCTLVASGTRESRKIVLLR